MPILLLTTTGRRTGRTRTVPLMYLRDGEDYVVTASNGGRRFHPAWYLNLKSNPKVEVRVMEMAGAAVAETLAEREKDPLWRTLVERAPFFGDYQRRTTRPIPMVRLRNSPPSATP